MFGLTRDFVQFEGTRMVLGRSEGLLAEELNPVEVRMLGSQEIGCHLPFYLKEVDLCATMEYSLSGARMLSHLLKGAKLGLTELFALLLQIAEAMEAGILHMLRPEQYALHEDYIFVEGELTEGRIYLTYIPLGESRNKRELSADILRLTSTLLTAVSELRGDGVQRLLQYGGSEEFTIRGWKLLLSALLTGEDAGPSNNPPEPDRPKPERPEAKDWLRGYSPLRGKPVAEPATEWNEGDSERPGEWGGAIFGANSAATEENGAALTVAEPPVAQNRIYWLVGCAMADLLLWRFGYLDHPERVPPAAAGAGTLVLGVIALMAWRGKIGGGRRENSREKWERGRRTNEEDNEAIAWGTRKSPESYPEPFIGIGFDSYSDPLASEEENDRKPTVRPAERIGWGWTEQRSDGNGRRVEEPATALLVERDEERNNRNAAAQPFLERTQEGGEAVEVIPLTGGSFIIGRSKEVAQYVEPSEGASRVHVEISRSGGMYVLKDLDSRNGTRLGDEPLVPYKEYPLREGDVFTVIGGRYRFRSSQTLTSVDGAQTQASGRQT